VEEILNSRMFRWKLQYLVKWEGYGIEGNTWEYLENLAHAREKVTEFHTRNPGALHRIRALTFGSIPFRPIPLPSASSRCLSRGGVIVRGSPYASDSRPSSASDSRLSSASAPATSSLFRNAFGRMTSYAIRSRPASLPTCLPLMTR